jgi:hypothetical protein
MLTPKFVSRKISIPGDVARECAQCLLPFFATCQRGSRKTTVAAKLILKRRTKNPSPQSSPRKRGEAVACRLRRAPLHAYRENHYAPVDPADFLRR